MQQRSKDKLVRGLTFQARIMGVIVASWLCISVHAQFLDLDPMPEKPTFESSQLLQREAEHLRSEIDLLQSYDTQDEVIATISSALKTYRRVAFALLAQARVKPDAHHAALAGLLLASECDDIDRALVLLGESPSRTRGLCPWLPRPPPALG